MPIDDDLLHIIQKAKEKEIEGRVYEKIRSDLRKLKFLGGAVAVAIAIMALFHKQVFTAVVNWGGTEFRNTIEAKVKKQSEDLAKWDVEARATQKAIERQVDTYLDVIVRQRETVLTVKGELDNEKKAVVELLTSLREARDTTTTRSATAQAAAQKALDDLSKAQVALDAVVQNQTTIFNQLKTLKADLPSPIAATAKAPPAPEKRGTVYFQFAGFSREEARAISGKIRDSGWRIPGEERTPLAADRADTNQIRYNSADYPIAERLRGDANTALQTLNYRISLELKENPRVTPGIVEIWILKP